MLIRPATRKDFREFYGKLPTMSVKAIIGIKNGEIVALGGYYFRRNVAIAFTELKKEKLTRREVIKGGRAVMELLKNLGQPIYATSDTKEAVALKHFGFEQSGDYWVWSP